MYFEKSIYKWLSIASEHPRLIYNYPYFVAVQSLRRIAYQRRVQYGLQNNKYIIIYTTTLQSVSSELPKTKICMSTAPKCTTLWFKHNVNIYSTMLAAVYKTGSTTFIQLVLHITFFIAIPFSLVVVCLQHVV